MIKNISTIKLIGILAGLAMIYFAVDFFGGKGRSRSFREELVEIDTAQVNKIVIISKGKSLELLKEEGNWKTGIGGGNYASAQTSSINDLFATISQIKPSRIVAKSPEKWKEYQVDSAGTRFQTYENGKLTLDLIIGRFGIHGQREFFTYVRLFSENEVYAADNFMGMSLRTNSADFRNQQFLTLTADSLQEVHFNYPADSAFILEKTNGKWMLNAHQLDSTNITGFFNDVRYMKSSGFVDDVPANILNTPTLTIIFKENSGDKISISAFRHPTYNWILQSSLNSDSYFSDNSIIDKLLKNKDSFIKREDR